MGTGTLLPKSSGWPRTSEKGIERIRQLFSRSPSKSIRSALVRASIIKPRHDCTVPHQSKRHSDFKEKITAAVETTDEEMLRRTWIEIKYRLDVLRATNGAHIEIY